MERKRMIRRIVVVVSVIGVCVPCAHAFSVKTGKVRTTIGGFVDFHTYFDVGANQSRKGALHGEKAPLENTSAANQTGGFNAEVRHSRIFVKSFVPTSLGRAKIYAGVDFAGTGGNPAISNSYGVRLRQFYVAMGRWLIGQTWTNFMDVHALPEYVDWGGDAARYGRAFLRQPMIRYAAIDMKGRKLYLAIENPSDGFVQGRTSGTSYDIGNHRAPAITLRFLEGNAHKGHIQVASVLRRIGYNDGEGNSASTWGYGFGVAGAYYFWRRDNVKFNINGGDGIGRFIQIDSGMSAIGYSHNELKKVPAYGGYVAYQHWFTSSTRINFIFGYSHVLADSALMTANELSSENRVVEGATVSVFRSFGRRMKIGVGYNYARRETFSGLIGKAQRVEMLVRVRF